MVNLINLSIHGNKLQHLDSRLFSYLHKLSLLDFEYNNIETLHNNIFSNLTNLRYLYMAHNHLKSLTDIRLFRSQTGLIDLTLDDNKIRTISAFVLSPLISLKKFKLANNPFECSCELQETIMWAESKCINTRATCDEPSKFKSQFWSVLRNETCPNPWAKIKECSSYVCTYVNDTQEMDCADLNLGKFETEHLPFNETKIVQLNLNNNGIQSLESNAFNQWPRITILQLSINELSTLKHRLFYTLKELTYLSLDNNLLESLDDRLFHFQEKLITLYIYNNKLLTITEKLMEPLITLHTLSLKGNRLTCDCKLQSTFTLLMKRGVWSDAMCETPEKYAGKSWKLMEKELECGITVQYLTISTQTVIIVSSGMILFCCSSVVVCYVCIGWRKTCRKRTNRHTNENVQYDDVETMANTSPKTARFSNTENLYDYPILRNSYLSIIDPNVKSEPVIYDDVV
ncbi:hypothetical protein L9F63_019944 [Diploptera punctata]|uniref:LRRCT domain-containing protein n=1 Tax=Diploptera punctata TaxID=6984 RepID=A0AAD8EE07_DIPPU|nr:hypothetical protein L9F63_019944 [Diploptera punctata]